MLSSEDGRHLVMMPHLERSTFPWNWAHYPGSRKDEVSPWTIVFENAFAWLEEKLGNSTRFHYLTFVKKIKTKASNETD